LVVSLNAAFKQYSELRSKNWSVEQISTFLGMTLKEEATQAYAEATQLREIIKKKEADLERVKDETLSKHTGHIEYINLLISLNDVKDVNEELCVCNDVIKILELKKQLLTPEVRENQTLLMLLHNAIMLN
jgi:hypothetical protein